jgi:A/G-specific adenine glycosylase
MGEGTDPAGGEDGVQHPHANANAAPSLDARPIDAHALAADLLAWYDASARVLPWRSPPGVAADPYHVWLSEIMLQQTTVKAVIPYYLKFLQRWPTAAALASAEIEEVMAAWAGLGYYSRARNLHACAKAVAERHGGVFPSGEAALLALPGIGAYTAAAIAAIAFDRRATAVDGNIERVAARLFAVEEPLPAAKPRIKALAARLTPHARPGDFTQAMMDLGASICSPRSPSCLVCPVRAHCSARARGIAERLPVKAKKGEKPRRFGVAFLATRSDGAVLLRRRPPRGLLGGMLEVPSTEWGPAMPEGGAALDHVPLAAAWRPLGGTVRHVFTHFELGLAVWRADGLPMSAEAGSAAWYPREALADEAVPGVMRKVLRHGLDGG